MATDSLMEDVPPVTTDGGLQPPSVIKQWTLKDLFNFAPIQKSLWNDKNQVTFWNAEISSRVFLRDGDIRDFWLHQCGLPIGVSSDLAQLSQMIKDMGK